jgi:hypothetical protein
LNKDAILREISDYCRKTGIAETTFGRLAVNDGKLAQRLRYGGRITTDTLDRLRAFMASHEPRKKVTAAAGKRAEARAANGVSDLGGAGAPARRADATSGHAQAAEGEKHFRFFDNRQKYLLFVNTCSEKWVVAQRVARELANIHPQPPAVRLFDAGVGDGTVLTRVMRAMHQKFPTKPLYIVGKEISLEDVRVTLDKMPDRFFEHPATVLVMTNLYYSEAPWLKPNSMEAATSLVWHEVVLTGNTSHEFEEQITALQSFLSQNWTARVSKSGNPIYDRPVVLVIYRDDHRFLLDPVIPKRVQSRADYDLVIASQPYRAKSSAEFKARNVLAPLARSLGPGGRLIAIHSYGQDPGMEIVSKVWPDYSPFRTNRQDLLKATKAELGPSAQNFNFHAFSDSQALFRYEMHTLPSEVDSTIGTSTAFAAWNAVIYVAQVEDQLLEETVKSDAYLEATREVLKKHGGLWFYDESFVISRKRN